jgi:hypothetical protein
MYTPRYTQQAQAVKGGMRERDKDFSFSHYIFVRLCTT